MQSPHSPRPHMYISRKHHPIPTHYSTVHFSEYALSARPQKTRGAITSLSLALISELSSPFLEPSIYLDHKGSSHLPFGTCPDFCLLRVREKRQIPYSGYHHTSSIIFRLCETHALALFSRKNTSQCCHAWELNPLSAMAHRRHFKPIN